MGLSEHPPGFAPFSPSNRSKIPLNSPLSVAVPVTSMLSSLIQARWLTGASCAATCVAWLVARSHRLACGESSEHNCQRGKGLRTTMQPHTA